MIARIWHGWTTPANADAYEALLRGEIFPGIRGRRIAGLRGIDLLRRPAGAEVEFVTVMWFESLDDVRRRTPRIERADLIGGRSPPAG